MVRYVGAPIAAVIAADRYLAEDAIELVRVEYEELPTVVDADVALDADAPRLFADWPDDRMMVSRITDPDLDDVLARAPQVVRGRNRIGRHTAMPIETRATVANFADGRLTVWTGTHHPHITRTTLSYVLPLVGADIRVISPDVGARSDASNMCIQKT